MSKLNIKNIRLGGCSIFKPRAYAEGSPENYSAIFLIERDDPQIKMIQKAIAELARTRWQNKVPKSLKTCLVDGEEKDNEAYHDYVTISASEKVRPSVVNRDTSPVYEEDGTVYSGCYVNAILTLWAQDNQYGKRINANLRAIQFVRKGDPIGRAPINVEEEFEDLSDSDTVPFNQEDPLLA